MAVPNQNRPMGASQARLRAQQLARQRRRKRQLEQWLRLAVLATALLVVAGIITGAITLVNRLFQKPEEPPVSVGEEMSILAPLPFAQNQQSADLEPRNIGPAMENTGLTSAEEVWALPECGIVETTYFSDAAFLGDSITEGFTAYQIDLSGALVCGYIGASPNQIVNRTQLKHPERGEEVALEVLAAAQPAKLYVLLGTNTLTVAGNDDSFLAYYGRMLDELQAALPGTQVYVQSVTPVRPEVQEKSAGLENGRLAALNREIAAMAAQRGMYYLDLWECFGDESGALREELAQPDGIHVTVQGYMEWVGYLCRHTKYDRNSPYLPGSDYAMG